MATVALVAAAATGAVVVVDAIAIVAVVKVVILEVVPVLIAVVEVVLAEVEVERGSEGDRSREKSANVEEEEVARGQERSWQTRSDSAATVTIACGGSCFSCSCLS